MVSTTSVVVPLGWSVEQCPETGAELFTAPTVPDSGFRPRATLAAGPTALPLRAWLGCTVEEIRAALTRVSVEECEIQELGWCEAAYLRVLHRVHDRDMMTEVWGWITDETVWTLTATVDLADYADFDEVFEELAWSFMAS